MPISRHILNACGLDWDDIRQEAFLYPGPFAAYNAIRKYGWAHRRKVSMVAMVGYEPTLNYCSHEDAAIAKIDTERLLNRVTKAQREATTLHYLEGFTQSDLAEVLGISVRAANNRCALGIQKMRQYVQTR